MFVLKSERKNNLNACSTIAIKSRAGILDKCCNYTEAKYYSNILLLTVQYKCACRDNNFDGYYRRIKVVTSVFQP